ncbi:hypothetical protein ACHAXT_006680 [Thalassiosira profunda]
MTNLLLRAAAASLLAASSFRGTVDAFAPAHLSRAPTALASSVLPPPSRQAELTQLLQPELGEDDLYLDDVSSDPPRVGSLMKLLPEETWDINTAESLSYFFIDLAAVAASMGALNALVTSDVYHSLPVPLQALTVAPLQLLTGFAMVSRTDSARWINRVVGEVAHSVVCLTPFEPWAHSHRRHHVHHNHKDRDYSHQCYFIYLFLGVPDGGHVIFHGRMWEGVPLKKKIDAAVSVAVSCATAGTLWYNMGTADFTVVCMVPWLVLSWWLFMVTYLQHHSEDGQVFTDETYTFEKGAFQTVDRSYGSLIDKLSHHMMSGHLVHHLFFTKVPHYRLEEATIALRKGLDEMGEGDLYKFVDTPDFNGEIVKRWQDDWFFVNESQVEYKVYHAQALVKSGSYADAQRFAASTEVAANAHAQRLKLLQAHAEQELGMSSACSATLSSATLEEDDPERIMALATLEYREGRFSKALELFKIAKRVQGDQSFLFFNVALCHYQQGDHDAALKLVDGIIDEAREEQQDDDVTNTNSLLVEALNLKAALYNATGKVDAAKEITNELCELSDSGQLDDAVSIHNDAVANIAADPTVGMQKLEYLLANQLADCPETLGNLLTLYTTHGQESLVAEIFEANKELARQLLPPDAFAYFHAISLANTCPADALAMLEAQSASFTRLLRSGKRDVSEAISSASVARPATSHRAATTRPTTAAERKDQRALDAATKEFEGTLDRFIPAVLLQARLYWDQKNYSAAAGLLEKSADFCSGTNAWQMNMGHVLFAQQKFDQSIRHYKQLLASHSEADLLKVPPVALANLCVAYILTNNNEAAEALIKAVEREEQQQSALGNQERTYHSCIINLAVGTLYCERGGQYDFGISRVCKSLEPFEKHLSQDTWSHAKLCFLSLASKISKAAYSISDDTLQEIVNFLEDVQGNGKHIVVGDEDTGSDPLNPSDPVTIASEAGLLKDTFVKIS